VEKNREVFSFAHNASHDLKEPMRTIGGYAAMLAEMPAILADPESCEFLASIQIGTNRMVQLIDSLLQLAEVGASNVGTDPVALDDVLDRVEHDLGGSLRDSGGRIRRDEPLPVVQGNAVQIRQVFQNLVANGLKFRRTGVAPVVSISAAPADTGGPGARPFVTITLTDNGIGFPSERATRIFEPFRRFHSRSEYPGTGLGLAIVRKVVERHGGRISAEGQPNQGTRFTFTLPVNQAIAA
jgi:signal transduction histidine kinase